MDIATGLTQIIEMNATTLSWSIFVKLIPSIANDSAQHIHPIFIRLCQFAFDPNK